MEDRLIPSFQRSLGAPIPLGGIPQSQADSCGQHIQGGSLAGDEQKSSIMMFIGNNNRYLPPMFSDILSGSLS